MNPHRGHMFILKSNKNETEKCHYGNYRICCQE